MAAKIKDGLFIGDAETSQSEVFINDNKISNLINVSGRDVPNVWASHGLVYLTYNWENRADFRLFSGHEDSILTDIVDFIDVSISHGISVLIFSKQGTGRCIIAACLYLMIKYRWGFEKAYDYIFSKKPDLDLNKGFIQQMFALDMKLLASRQKAYALKHSQENVFRIEPNMTINDIAAMLPPNEAKRWNSWDPNYILCPALDSKEKVDEEQIHWQRYGESVISTLKKKDYSTLKMLFLKQKAASSRALDDMEEELVLIFSFINSKNTITSLPGPYTMMESKSFKLRFSAEVFEEDVNWFPPPSGGPRARAVLKGVPRRPVPAVEDKETAHHPVTASRASNGGMEDHGTSTSTHSNSNSSTADLYKFVGMGSASTSSAAQAKDRDQSTSSGARQDKKTSSLGLEDKYSALSSSTSSSAVLSTEERLRKLMADMHRPATSSAVQQQQQTQQAPPRYTSNTPSVAPSLYDLANMPTSSGVPQGAEAKDFEESDPLEAFRGTSSNSASTGVMRARHDILSASARAPPAQVGKTPTSSRQAWAPPVRTAAVPSTPTRYASPSPSGGQSSNFSVTSVGSAGSSHQQGQYVGGGGTSSAKVYRHGSPAPNTRPSVPSSPSARPRPSSPAPPSGGMSVLSASMSSLGSIGSNAPPPSRYASPSTRVPPPPVSSRYASPTPSTQQQQRERERERERADPRRSSFSSNNSVGSNSSQQPPPPDKRRSLGSSQQAPVPAMRQSYARPSSPAPDPYSSKRFSTPTPQSAQHYDYEQRGSGSSGTGTGSRPSTPTRGWKF